MIGIIDYDAGNLKSVEKACIYLGEETTVTRDPEILLHADKIILPGVGAFGDAMEKLNYYKLPEVIKQIINNKIPFLGICLGLQLLFEKSEESPGIQGLGILKGEIVRLPEMGLKIPHVGWNSLAINSKSQLYQGIEEVFVYFVHSYYLKADENQIVSATAEYGIEFHASVEKDNIFGCQFHPEKSGEAGLKILQNFIGIGKKG